MKKSSKTTVEKNLKKLDIKVNSSLSCEDYKKIVDSMIACIGTKVNISVTVKDIFRGRAYFIEKAMILPVWLGEYDVAYQVYYAIHEFTHCMIGYKHDDTFKFVEDVLLELWGIKIVRMKVYPKKLFLDGKEILNIPYNKRFEDKPEAADKAAGEING